MKLIDMTCPHCSAHLKVDSSKAQAICEHCGATILIDDEVQHIRYDNAEEAGYNFEKGRQRAKAEARRESNNYYSQRNGEPPKKKRRTWLWVIGWICIFPLPLTILLLRKKEMKPAIKYGIIAAAWIVYLIIGLAGGSGNSDKTTDNPAVPSASESVQTTESTLDATSTEQLEKQSSESTTDNSSAAQTEVETELEPVEMNALQILFSSITSSMTREEVDAYISENGMVKFAFTHDSAYYIGYESSAIRQRGRDRVGEAVDINFTNDGTVKSAEYAIHTEASTHYALKFENGIFYYEGKECSTGEEAMQKFLAANQ